MWSAVLIGLSLIVGCSRRESSPSQTESVAFEPSAAAPQSAEKASNGPMSPDAVTSSRPGDTTATVSATVGMLIRTGAATVEVDSLELAIGRLQQMAARVGGAVGNTSLRTGDEQVREATVELRLPAARFDDAVGGLKPLGKIETVTVTAEDVGEEFVDVTARVSNARRLESRLIELLATRTGKLEEVLQVEQELARVREEIERYDGRLRYLRSRVAVSTLTVSLHEPRPLFAGDPADSPIRSAFRQSWENFVGFIALLIASLGVLVPLGLLLLGAALLIRRFRRPNRPPPPPR